MMRVKKRLSRSIATGIVFLLVALSCFSFASAESSAGSIRGTIWDDVNINGIRDKDEKPLQNISVEIRKVNDETTINSTATDASGKYVFENLGAEEYEIIIKAPGMSLTTKNAYGSNERNNSDFGSGTGVIAARVRLKYVTSISSLDAGLFKPTASSATTVVSGYTWLDGNHNGLYDPNESMMHGITLVCKTSSGMKSITKSRWDGYYEFDFANSNGDFGEAIVKAIQPDGYMFTYYQIDKEKKDMDSDFSRYRGTTNAIDLEPDVVINNIWVGLLLCPVFTPIQASFN